MYLRRHFLMGVKMGVLTNDYFCLILLISLLMAKVIPVQRTKYHHFAGYAAVFARRYSTVILGR